MNDPAAQAGHPLSLLGFGTIGIVLLLAVVALAWFWRNRRHRHPMAGERERNIDEIRREAPANRTPPD
jgi:hypothetical protein